MEPANQSWFLSAAPDILRLWLNHMLVAVFLSAPIVYFSRDRARWKDWELLAFVVPFGVWMALMESGLPFSNSLGNLAAEALLLTLAIPVAALIRIPLGGLRHQQLYSAILLVALCGVGVGLYFLMPTLPE